MAFRRRVPPTPPMPKIEPLNPGEVRWRDNQIEIARVLAERYANDTTPLPDVTILDLVVAGWLDDDSTRVDINAVVNGVGIAMGQHVANLVHLDWVIATDDKGSELALHGQPGDILIYPANAAAKRIAAGESGFVASLVAQLVSGVEQRRSQGSGTP